MTDWEGKWDRLGLLFEPVWLRVDELRLDPGIQREVRQEKVAAIVREFDEMGLGVFTVSHRLDGHDYIVDGQHRWQAVRQRGLGRHLVFCARARGLDLDGERYLFRMLNRDRLPLSPFETFRSQMESDGDIAASAIAETLARWRVTLVPPRARLGPREVCAVSVLREIDADDEKALDRVLRVIASGWGDVAGSHKATYLRAVWQVLRRGWASERQLIAALKRTPPPQLDRQALQRQRRPGERPLQAYVAALRDACGDMSEERVITLRDMTG